MLCMLGDVRVQGSGVGRWARPILTITYIYILYIYMSNDRQSLALALPIMIFFIEIRTSKLSLVQFGGCAGRANLTLCGCLLLSWG